MLQKFDRRNLALLPAIGMALIAGSITSPAFLTANNLIDNIVTTSAVLGILVLAESVVLIGGNFDLSLEGIVGLAPMLMAIMVAPAGFGGGGHGWNPYLGLAIALAASMLVGLVNGLLVAKLQLNAFIVTLAMLTILQGLTLGVSNGQTISQLPDLMTVLGRAKVAGVPIQAVILVVAFALGYLFMNYTPTGRRIYAMGGSPHAARVAGIRTSRLTIGTFVVGALLAAIAGLMLTSRIAVVTPGQGQGVIFTVFAAAVIGGISLNGGRGGLAGAFLGVVLLGIITNILTLSNVPSFWSSASYGGIILVALLLGRLEGFARRRPKPEHAPATGSAEAEEG